VTAGLGLGWQIIQINDETIVDHSGSDWAFTLTPFPSSTPRSAEPLVDKGNPCQLQIIQQPAPRLPLHPLTSQLGLEMDKDQNCSATCG
jgi:hypothetical protein